jgi:hypothetical protein
MYFMSIIFIFYYIYIYAFKTKGERGQLGCIDLAVCEFLATLGVISGRSAEDHEAARYLREGALFLLSIVCQGVRLLLIPVGIF